jgi:hypothetical protein
MLTGADPLSNGFDNNLESQDPYPNIGNDQPDFLNNDYEDQNDTYKSLKHNNDQASAENDDNLDKAENDSYDNYQQNNSIEHDNYSNKPMDEPENDYSNQNLDGDDQADPNVSDEPDFQKRLEQLQGIYLWHICAYFVCRTTK